MPSLNAATTFAVLPTDDHICLGSGESTTLRTNVFLRLSTEYLRGRSPAARVAAWTLLLLESIMAQPVSIGRNHWMRLNIVIYLNLNSK